MVLAVWIRPAGVEEKVAGERADRGGKLVVATVVLVVATVGGGRLEDTIGEGCTEGELDEGCDAGEDRYGNMEADPDGIG